MTRMTCQNHRVDAWNANMFQARCFRDFRAPYQRLNGAGLSNVIGVALGWSS